MAKIKLAEYRGFCYGVERIISIINNYLKHGNTTIYTYGPIIHNPVVIKHYEKMGVKIVNEPLKKPEEKNAILIIRSHGASKNIFELAKKLGYKVIDGTCPWVKKVHVLIEEMNKNNYIPVIIGKKLHPEVKASISYVKNKFFIIEKEEDIYNIDKNKKLWVVAQTTELHERFNKFVNLINKIAKPTQLKVDNTICDETQKRQQATYLLAKQVDILFIVGGKNSSNTRKLYNIGKSILDRTYHIETIQDFEEKLINKNDIVGIAAGASTPQESIDDLIKLIKGI